MGKEKILHPGEVLNQKYLLPKGLSGNQLAKLTGMPQTRISQIINKKRRVTADTALRFARIFKTKPQFWMTLQMEYDLFHSEQEIGRDLAAIRPV